MADLGNQTITITLFGDPATGSPTHVQSYLYVPSHIHQHKDLAGLYEDNHPQYLTEARGANLFIDLSRQLLDSTTAANLGAGEGIYYSKINDELKFKSLVAGTNVSFTVTNDTITINSTASGGGGSAALTTYTPTTPADWAIVPITVKDGLDYLAAKKLGYAQVRTISVGPLLSSDDKGLVLIDTAGTYALATVAVDYELTIKNISSGVVVLTSGSNIDGLGSRNLNPNDSIHLYSTATTYWRV